MVEWEVETAGVIDDEFLAERMDQLSGASRLNITSARFDSEESLHKVLVTSLEKIDFSFFEVGAKAGELRPYRRTETNRALRLFADARSLKSVQLPWSYAIDDSGTESLSKLHQIENLALESDITDVGLARLGQLVQLHTLDLTCSTKFTGTGFCDWPEMPKLRALCLSQCDRVTDDVVSFFAKTPKLDFLVLNGCKQLSLPGLQRLRVGDSLESLMLFGMKLDLKTVRALRENNPKADIDINTDHFSESEMAEVEALLFAE